MSHPDGTVLAVDALLDGLDESQREAVMSTASPLAILAGAGSGKTRVLTRRIAWQSRERRIDPRHVLALTFTRKAAGELRTRLARSGMHHAVTAGTFHAIALAQLGRRAADAHRSAPSLLDRKVRLLVPLVGVRGRGEAGLAAAEIAAEIEWAKARLVTPDRYEQAVGAAGRTPPRPAVEVAAIFGRYEREKRRRGLVDFDDLIIDCADALTRDATFADVQRWRFRHLFVDEFQDVTPAQFRLLRAWLGDRADLCVVGDPRQSIYAFAGADADMLVRFRRYFPTDTFTAVGTVQLAVNYRSSPEIVAAATAALGPSAGRAAPRAVRPEGPAPTVTAYNTDTDEAAGVARWLRRRQGPDVRWSRLAVLYRTNAQSALFEAAFSRAGVPFRVRGDERFLDRAEVKVALDALRDSARAAPARRFEEHLTDLAADASELPEERREHVDALVQLAREYLGIEGSGGSVEGFLEFLRTNLRGNDDVVGSDAVELLTFHRAKGLEFDTVFVTGLERGLVPISHAKAPSALDEEQRLLHVAMTRAERELHLSWAASRTLGGRSARRNPSPFLARIQRAIDSMRNAATNDTAETGARTHIERARDRVRAAGRATATRSKTPEVGPGDQPLVDALVAWRLGVSRASGAPAYVIFHDTTVHTIAAARPRTRAELLSVPGIGPVKAERYGDAVLALVGEHSGGAGRASDPGPVTSRP